MAKTAPGSNDQQLRYVLLLVVVAALVIGVTGAVVVGAARPPPSLVMAEQLPQGLLARRSAAAGRGTRRLLVGSRAPTTCTYNECRGCRHRCSVREVPVDASDPVNSAYHYRCVCHM